VGAQVDLHLEPEDAFGDFDENLLFLEPKALFPKDIEEGLTIEGTALPAGCNPDAPRNVLYTITEIYPEHLVLDGNHPLSGIALRIHLKVNHVRMATTAEQEAGTCGTGFFKIEIGDTPGSAGGLLH
jgi:FKBP-type peptidyl-prolyl cis-trans isomerase SlyD